MTLRMQPGAVFIPSRQSRAFIVVEAGQRWRCRDKRYADHEIYVVRKVDGRAYYRDHAGVVRYMACDDLRKRYRFLGMDA